MPKTISNRRFLSRGMMPIIAEDECDSDSPDLPKRSPMRAVHYNAMKLKLQPYPYPGSHLPPPYSPNTPPGRNMKAPLDPPPPKDRRPGWFVERGGWIRVVLFGVLGVFAITALVVGLVLGLRRRGHGGDGDSTSPAPDVPMLFPAGSYSFVTALWNTSTACTSNSATFRCYPFTTYDPSSPTSETDAMATFLWTIAARAGSTYDISTAPSPFVPQFNNISLNLIDGNQDSERLVFELGQMVLEVLPVEPITSDSSSGSGKATKCFFNDTVLSATIWTRKSAEYPTNLTTSVDNKGNGTHTSENFDPWPYAVEVSQVAGAGAGVPDCRDADGNQVGDFEIPRAAGGGDCGCWYRNFDLN
ncbi:hypothetical protein HD806DRAFT_47392 [Xylariaceae sp. AK1471]|nr:hypothetical protein HD806DRAFT_47392 [Xylariaceae sp. AK1471]